MTRKLTVMMFTWEFPPRIIGGISPHVNFLSKNLVKNGVKVYVVTCDFPGTPKHEIIDGVEVLRVDSYKSPAPDFATWIYLMNVNMQQEAAALVHSLDGNVDLFHAHDWLVATAGIGLKHVFRKPLLATIHSTEIGRRNGLHNDFEKMIHETEAWLAYEAWKVICCSNYMVSHVQWAYTLPTDKLVKIENGVNIDTYMKTEKIGTPSFREKFALPNEKIILFVGRLVYEKGVHVLVNAVPKILEKVDAKIIIIGSGYMKEQILTIARNMNLPHKILLTGFVDSDTLINLQQCADVCVVPSLFEPFGIVALEAMAAKSPVIVADTGGLSEIVEHDVDGIKVFPNNVDSLALGITKVLLDENYANWLKKNAYKKIQKKYRWEKIAEHTKKLYESVLNEYSKSLWT